MGTLHVLPARISQTDWAAHERVVDGLKQAIAEGVELGPRGPHIRSLALSREAVLPALRVDVATALDWLPEGDAMRLSAEASIARFIGDVERILELVRADTLAQGDAQVLSQLE